MSRSLLFRLSLLGLVAAPTEAGTQDTAITFGLVPRPWGGMCSTPSPDVRCRDATYDLSDYHIPDFPTLLWLCVFRDGGFTQSIGAIEFGIEYDATIEIGAWTLCTGGSEIPQYPLWPGSGAGNIVTWEYGCYPATAEIARVGFFTISSLSGPFEGSFAITGDPRIGQALWISCDADEFEVCAGNLQSADLGGSIVALCGDNCAVPVERSSWSRIKGLYGPR